MHDLRLKIQEKEYQKKICLLYGSVIIRFKKMVTLIKWARLAQA